MITEFYCQILASAQSDLRDSEARLLEIPLNRFRGYQPVTDSRDDL